MTIPITANDSFQKVSSAQSLHFATADCADLANFYKDKYNLCWWNPPTSQERDKYAQQLANSEFNFAKIVTQENLLESLDFLPTGLGLTPMKLWIVKLVDLFSTLFELDEVGLRISCRERPMCPKFHFDRVQVRLVHSLHGEGSEWIEAPTYKQGEQVDSWVEKSKSENSLVINKVPPRSVILMKGATWKEGIPPVIHRSPQHNMSRVVLTLDQV